MLQFVLAFEYNLLIGVLKMLISMCSFSAFQLKPIDEEVKIVLPKSRKTECILGLA